MKLSPEQIDQIITGLENRKTKMVATHNEAPNYISLISKTKTGEYKNRFSYEKRLIENNFTTKENLIDLLKNNKHFTFELVTKNKDKSEERVKI